MDALCTSQPVPQPRVESRTGEGTTSAHLGSFCEWDCREEFPAWPLSRWKGCGPRETLSVTVPFCLAEPWHGGGWERDPGPEHEQTAAAGRMLPDPDAPGAPVPPAGSGEQPVLPAERRGLLGPARGLHQDEAPQDGRGRVQRDHRTSLLGAPPPPASSTKRAPLRENAPGAHLSENGPFPFSRLELRRRFWLTHERCGSNIDERETNHWLLWMMHFIFQQVCFVANNFSKKMCELLTNSFSWVISW